MNRALFRLPTPEDSALTRARLTLAALRATLAARESALAHLRGQLHSFEGRYIRQVGVLYVQLDDWYRRIAALDSPLELPPDLLPPSTPTEEASASTTDPEPATPNPQPDIKTLFRQLARRIHPDLALNPLDELRRTRLMALANDALRRADAALLHRMVHAHDHDPALLTPAAALAETLSLIGQAQLDLVRIDEELHELAHSEMALLERRTLAAAQLGQDLLAELAARVKGSIGIAMSQYERDLARHKRRQPAPPPTGPAASRHTP